MVCHLCLMYMSNHFILILLASTSTNLYSIYFVKAVNAADFLSISQQFPIVYRKGQGVT